MQQNSITNYQRDSIMSKYTNKCKSVLTNDAEFRDLVKDIRKAYDAIVVNDDPNFEYSGFDTKSTGTDESISYKLTPSSEYLSWALNEQGHDSIQVVIECAIQLGIYQGMALTRKEPYDHHFRITKENYDEVKKMMTTYEQTSTTTNPEDAAWNNIKLEIAKAISDKGYQASISDDKTIIISKKDTAECLTYDDLYPMGQIVYEPILGGVLVEIYKDVNDKEGVKLKLDPSFERIVTHILNVVETTFK